MSQLSDSRKEFTEKVNAAFAQAALEVIRVARATSTSIIIWRDGQIVHLSPDEAEQHLEQQKQKPPHES